MGIKPKSEETLELRPTRRQNFFHHLTNLVIGLVLATLGLFAAFTADLPLSVIGWLIAGVAGASLFYTVADLVGPPHAYMRLTAEGFEARRRSERAFVPWAAAKSFYLTRGHGENAPLVLMWEWNEDHPIAPDLVKSRSFLDVLMRKAGFSDRVVFLPPGFTSEDLFPIMASWHGRALGKRD